MSDTTTNTQPTSTENDEELQALTHITERRRDTYAMLSRFFRKEVDKGLLDDLYHTRFPMATGDAKVDEGYRLIATYLSNDHGDTLTELAVDYMRTFIGHGVDGYSAAYPFESVYTSDRRLLMQGSRKEVLAFYRKFGIDKDADWHEPEDHIALELEFMQILAGRMVDALKEGDMEQAAEFAEAQKDFVSEHLVNWVPMMTGDMEKFCKTSFYRGVANLLEGFIRTDLDLLTDILTED